MCICVYVLLLLLFEGGCGASADGLGAIRDSKVQILSPPEKTPLNSNPNSSKRSLSVSPEVADSNKKTRKKDSKKK